MRMDNTGIPPSDTIVEVRQLWTAFGSGAKQVVIHKDLDLTIRRGEVLTLVGGSGTGKTVLLRQILGLESPFRGQVTVLENIAFPLRELKVFPPDLINEVALVKLQMVGLGPEHAHKMPSDLSGGMIKRVALARALSMDPPLLLLDEPTAGLDPNGSDEFCALLRSLHEELGLTVVMVTHDLDTLFALSTRVAVLAEKQVIVSGPPHEVTQFKHPFIEHFFLGERGRRATTALPADAPAAVPAPLSPPSPTAPPPVVRKDP